MRATASPTLAAVVPAVSVKQVAVEGSYHAPFSPEAKRDAGEKPEPNTRQERLAYASAGSKLTP